MACLQTGTSETHWGNYGIADATNRRRTPQSHKSEGPAGAGNTNEAGTKVDRQNDPVTLPAFVADVQSALPTISGER
jgi:hypothetical protein